MHTWGRIIVNGLHVKLLVTLALNLLQRCLRKRYLNVFGRLRLGNLGGKWSQHSRRSLLNVLHRIYILRLWQLVIKTDLLLALYRLLLMHIHIIIRLFLDKFSGAIIRLVHNSKVLVMRLISGPLRRVVFLNQLSLGSVVISLQRAAIRDISALAQKLLWIIL